MTMSPNAHSPIDSSIQSPTSQRIQTTTTSKTEPVALRESALQLIAQESELRKAAQEAAAARRARREAMKASAVESPRPSPLLKRATMTTPRGFAEAFGEDGDDEDDDVLALNRTGSMDDWVSEERERRLSDIEAAVALETEKLNADRERAEKMSDLMSSQEERISKMQLEQQQRAIEEAAAREASLLEPPLPALPEPVQVPRWEGWVKKKGRSSLDLWRWRYCVLEHNFLQWWKRKEDFQASAQPWGYLDFTTVPPHVAEGVKKEVRIEMPGRQYRLWCGSATDMDALAEALRAQERHTRTRVLKDQTSAMAADLANANHLFRVQFNQANEAAAAQEALKFEDRSSTFGSTGRATL